MEVEEELHAIGASLSLMRKPRGLSRPNNLPRLAGHNPAGVRRVGGLAFMRARHAHLSPFRKCSHALAGTRSLPPPHLF